MDNLNPVWKSCPPVCSLAWLPSFSTQAEALAFHESNGHACILERVWQCGEHWHFWSTYQGPSGGTSGNTRWAKHSEP